MMGESAGARRRMGNKGEGVEMPIGRGRRWWRG